MLDELEARLASDVTDALAFLNTVRANNPAKPIEGILERPDVQEALQTILDWLDDVAAVVNALPATLSADKTAATATIAKARTDLTVDHIWAFPQATNQFRLRMGWLLAWLVAPLMWLAALANNVSSKTWMSRLAPNTCSFCAALHGTTIPIHDSFAPYALAVGWTRVYGSLLTPPLHPNCQCYLIYI